MSSYLLAIKDELPSRINMRSVLGSVHLGTDRCGRDVVRMMHLHRVMILLLECLKVLGIVHLILKGGGTAAGRHVETHGLSTAIAHGVSARLRITNLAEGQAAHRCVDSALSIVKGTKVELGVQIEELGKVVLAGSCPVHGVILHFLWPYHRLLVVCLWHDIEGGSMVSARRWAAEGSRISDTASQRRFMAVESR